MCCIFYHFNYKTKITFLLGKMSPFYLNIKGMSIVYLNMNTKSNSYLRTNIRFLRYQMKVDWYFVCDMYNIRGQAPDSEGGGVILKGLEGFRGEPKESPSLRGGIRKFDQF